MRHPLVVVYDVSDDDRRALVRAALAPLADRPQQSGWLVPPTAGLTSARLARGLQTLLAPGDRLLVFEPCGSCARRARWLPDDQPYALQPVSASIIN